MNLLDKIERKLGRNFGIKGLMTYIIGLNAVVFFMMYFGDSIGKSMQFHDMLVLDPARVMQGEVWRLVTYTFIPPTFSMLWLAFVLYFYYMIGSNLEHEWGTFKFNAYYLIGMIGTTAAVVLTGGNGTAVYLNMSLFLAFAYIFPNYQILLFFILPIKVKYLAYLDAAWILFAIMTQPTLSGKLSAVIPLANFLMFFGWDIIQRLRLGRKAFYNRKAYESKIPRNITIHKCEICGRTEKDSKDIEFRYCMDCNGDHEYCMEHLETHTHVK